MTEVVFTYEENFVIQQSRVAEGDRKTVWVLPISAETATSVHTGPDELVNTSVEVFSNSELSRVMTLYAVPDSSSVLAYLDRYPFLVALLIDTSFAVRKRFPSAILSLVVLPDYEIPDSEHLYLSIAPDTNYASSRSLLRDLERGWWFVNMPRARGKLTVDLK